MKTEKKFDSVRMMREIRDRMSAEMADMTYEEIATYLEKHSRLAQEMRKTDQSKAA